MPRKTNPGAGDTGVRQNSNSDTSFATKPLADKTQAPDPKAGQVARPLNILAPLIWKDLQDGNVAAEQAGLPFFRAAGEKMIEAKPQMKHGEFGPWIKRHFRITERQARHYMALARATGGAQSGSALPFSSLSDFIRQTREYTPCFDQRSIEEVRASDEAYRAEQRARAEE